MEIQPTNKELAKRFFDVMIKTSTNHHVIIEQKRLIESCGGSIAQEFACRGTLSGFKIPRFRTKFYGVLETILREGSQRASEVVIRQDIANIRAKQFNGIPGSESAHVKPDVTSGSWEDHVKTLESDEGIEK